MANTNNMKDLAEFRSDIERGCVRACPVLGEAARRSHRFALQPVNRLLAIDKGPVTDCHGPDTLHTGNVPYGRRYTRELRMLKTPNRDVIMHNAAITTTTSPSIA